MFTRLLSLWVTGALLLPQSWVLAGTTSDNDEVYDDMTPTPDYDYNSTFDYYYYNGTGPAIINYDLYAILHETNGDENMGRANNVYAQDTNNQRNKESLPVYRHYVMLTGLLVLQVCQQT